MKHRKRANPFSLFSFQDIITGLSGIMIFLVLVQSLGIVSSRARTAEAQGSGTSETDDCRIGLRDEIAALEARLSEVRKRAARAVVVEGRAQPGEVEEQQRKLTEREQILAALVSQVHDLETQVEKAEKADAEDRAKVREMERTRRLLEQQIAGMGNRRGITLIPERGTFKIPVYMICSGSGIEIHRPFERQPVVRLESANARKGLSDYLGALDQTTHAAVLLVRPTGVKMMALAVSLLVDRSFDYGRDPLEENLDVTFKVGEG